MLEGCWAGRWSECRAVRWVLGKRSNGEGEAVDVAAMMKQKLGAVDGLTKGIEGLFKKNKVGAGLLGKQRMQAWVGGLVGGQDEATVPPPMRPLPASSARPNLL